MSTRGFGGVGAPRAYRAAIALAIVMGLAFMLSACSAPSAPQESASASSAVQATQASSAQNPSSSASSTAQASASNTNRASNLAKLMRVVEDGDPLSGQAIEALRKTHAPYTDNVDAMYQEDYELQSGCEIVSLAIALNATGVPTDPTELADKHLEVDGDYEYGYIESPYEAMGGSFPPGIVAMGNSYLETQGLSLRCHDLSGSSFEGLEALVELGYPVLVWTTLDQSPPTFEADGADWWIDEHCVVLYDLDDDYAYVSDPLAGFDAHDRETFQDVYEECGAYALYIR